MKPLTRSITHRGMTVDATYQLVGSYLPSDGISPAEYPVCDGLTLSVHGEDITAIVSEQALEEIAERLEREVDECSVPLTNFRMRQAGGVR